MRQIALLSITLAATLTASYLTWTTEEVVVADDAAVMYSARPADLSNVEWKSETLTVKIERRSDPHGDYLWLSSTERKEVPVEVEPPEEPAEAAPEPPPEGAEEAPPEEPEEPETRTEIKTMQWKGNEAATNLWESYAPLTALRELHPSAEELKAFGFEEPVATVTVTRAGGATSTLSIGGETYGSKDRYVSLEGHTYLVDDGDLRPLQYASTRLVERALFPQAEADLESVELTWEGQTARFVQANADDRAKAFWARAETPSEQDDTGGTWLGKLFRLKLRGYTTPKEIEGTLSPVMKFAVTGNGETWNVEVLRLSGEEPKYYARSEYNRSLVELTNSLARNAMDDLASVFPEAGE